MSADEVKHTPGPWGADNYPVIVRGLHFLAHAHYETAEGIANARLIAAAPELLEALKELLELTDDPNNDADPEESTFSFARSVVAKAEGRSNA